MSQNLQPWDALFRKMLFSQLGTISNMKILDFGSGNGITANHFEKSNNVTAIEPSEDMLKERCCENNYKQLTGSTDELKKLEDEAFDMIFCHNVLEYVPDPESVIKEFYRLLKPDGKLSVVKHNRNGRVMQMVVLLNDFESAKNILEGKNSTAAKFGTIRYYNDNDITKWCSGFSISKVYAMRTFWDLQQNQEIQKDPEWQEKMAEIEMLVSEKEEYQNIAFFHHLLITK